MKTVNKEQENISLNLTFILFKKEWQLCIPYLGKILLINGPCSSGKTTLVSKIALKYHLQTINIKKIKFDIVNPEINKVFLNILEKAESVLERKIKDISQLFTINTQILSTTAKESVDKLKYEAKEIMKTSKYKTFVLVKLFSAYYNEIKKYIFSGYNVVLDESLIKPGDSYDIFLYSCSYYPHIKTALLFNSVQETLRKTIIRNNKFFLKLIEYQDFNSYMKEQQEIEKANGGSESSYRIPGFILENFKHFYNFDLFLNESDILLQEITVEEMRDIIGIIAREQLKLIQILSSKNYTNDSISNIDTVLELEKITQEKFGSIMITTRKTNFNYILKLPDKISLNTLDDPSFIKYFLSEILLWLLNPSNSYKEERNFSGEGTSKDNNSYDLPYSKWFNKYYSEGIEKILQLRINELAPDLKEKISILPARYQLKSGNTDIKRIIEAINQLDIAENGIVLIPYNIGNKHWVGFILRKTASFEVVYIDPENNPIDSALLLDLKKSLGIEKHNFEQKLITKQKYNNCGSELIENFIYYLTGNRIEESEAVTHHSHLIENELIAEFPETLVLGEV